MIAVRNEHGVLMHPAYVRRSQLTHDGLRALVAERDALRVGRHRDKLSGQIGAAKQALGLPLGPPEARS